MECRAKSAEKESALLEEQLEELKKRLDEVTFILFIRHVKFENLLTDIKE